VLIERAYLVLRAVAVLSAATLITFLALPPTTRSLAWTPPRAPNFEGAYAVSPALLDAETVLPGQVVGPEDVVVDAEGRIYTGTVDGKLVRSKMDGGVEILAETGGRPLGLALGNNGDVFVADVIKGLLRVDREGHIERLAHAVEGRDMLFTNDVVMAKDGTLYFTDSSLKRGYGEHTLDIIEQDPSGRLMKLDPVTRQVTVLLRGLSFANGVALSADESFVLIVETGRYRIQRFWLRGDKRNLSEPFIENLPGFPDNIAITERGTFWVALFAPRNHLLDRLHPYPFLKDSISSLPESLMPKPAAWGIALELDADGRPLRSLHDPTGRRFRNTSSAFEHAGAVYVGTLTGTAIGRAIPPPIAP
jgi:sugar lactone lactonase YvrE